MKRIKRETGRKVARAGVFRAAIECGLSALKRAERPLDAMPEEPVRRGRKKRRGREANREVDAVE